MKFRLLAQLCLFAALIFSNNTQAQAEPWRTSAERIDTMIELIKANASYPFRRFYKAKVIQSYSEPQAWNLGFLVLVSEKMMRDLDDGPLMAVVAHEMAHRERWHLFSRIGLMIGGPIAAILEGDREDQSLSEDIGQFNQYVNLQQEIQADCLAYNWLKDLQQKGIAADPLDLNRATNTIMAMDFSQVDPQYFEDDPAYIRYQKIQKGYPKSCSLN